MDVLAVIDAVDAFVWRPWRATPWPFQVIGGLWATWLGLDLATGRRVRNRPAVDGATTWISPSEDMAKFGRTTVLAGAGMATAGMVGAVGWWVAM